MVYLGAVVLLVFLGLRFADVFSEQVALIGIAIEALMLLMLVMVMFYAPSEEPAAVMRLAENEDGVDDDEDTSDVIREVLSEIEEIGGQYASLAMKLETVAKSQDENLKELNKRVAAIQGLNLLESHAERLETTNALLGQLTESIEGMNRRVDALFGKELEYYVRQELERIVGRQGNGQSPLTAPQKDPEH
jgi:hypothetical protein